MSLPSISEYNSWRDYNNTIKIHPGGIRAPAGQDFPPYLELPDKSCNHKIEKETEQDYFCGKGFIRGKCKNGHIFIKRLYCHREWCPVCGKKDSVAHKRRMARWEGKVKLMQKMGYLVITIPEELRIYFRKRSDWNAVRRYWIRRLKRDGFQRGLCRWHWFGDKDLDKFHPHLNFLFESDRVPLVQLEEWREDYKKWLEKYCNCKIDKKVDIHFLYAGKKKFKKFFWLKYVTRATFLKYNDELAKEMFRYHVMMTWGKWKGETKNIENGSCPVCGNRIHWGRRCWPVGYINLNDYRDIGNGYWIDKWSYDYDPAVEDILSK